MEGNWALATLEDVLYVPGLSTNLFSIGAAVDHGIKATFILTGLTLINRADGKVIAIGHRAHQKLYRMDMESILPESMAYGLGASTSNSLQVWHQRLGHINNGTILKMIRLQAVDGLTINNSSATPFCEGCIMGKHHRLPFPREGRKRATRPGELIHTDVCGPMQTKSIGGSLYFVTFKDDFTGYDTVNFMGKNQKLSPTSKILLPE